MATLLIETAKVFMPFLESPDARFHAAFGGRGGMKSHYFAGALIEKHLAKRGCRSVCIREIQKTLAMSSKQLIEDILRKHKLTQPGQGFKIYNELIETPGDGLIIFQGMQDHNADSIKSLEGFDTAFVEEAQTITERSWNMLRPTLRKDGSQIWAGWNPRRKTDAIDRFFRSELKPTNAVILKTGWQDNRWWTKELEQERLDDLRMNPDQYDHIWEGGYISVATGAYFANCIQQARIEGRIDHIPIDKLLQVKAIVDIGASGSNSDAFAMWIEQTIGNKCHFIDYYEAQGQSFAAHVEWLRSNGYSNAIIILPHDGKKHDVVYNVTPESYFREAGFTVIVVPNQGSGAAKTRIEAAKRIFPQCFFDRKCEEGGLAALGWYHKKIDQVRGIDLGPEHDFSSHAADAFGLFAVAKILKFIDVKTIKPIKIQKNNNWKTM